MAQILDKQGLQHYANKMCNADNRKVGSKSLPTVLNEIDTAIDGFKTLFETEYGTPVNMELENNENVFSIGTGTNINKKDDVENSFTDIELRGNSLVNLCPPIKSGMISFNTNSEGINTSGYYKGFKMSNLNIKIGQTYTSILLGTNNIRAHLWNNIGIQINGTFGKFIATEIVSDSYLHFYPEDGNLKESDLTNLKVILLEGDWTNKPIPQYFEGMKSVGEKEDGNHKISISSTGENLINIGDFNFKNISWTLLKDGVFIKKDTNTHFHSLFPIKLKPKTNYTFSCLCNRGKATETYIKLHLGKRPHNDSVEYGGFIIPEGKSAWNKTFTTDEKGLLYINGYTTTEGITISNMTLVEGTTVGVYEPYKGDKKEISLNEPLRGLPNGVKDTIEKVNGEWKIVRRCGEVVLDGNRTWTIWSNNTDGQNLTYNAYVYSADLDITKKTTSDSNLNVINDKVTNHYRSFIDRTGESIIVASSILHLSILRTKLETQDTTGLKKWLSQNPIKVVYELATPIIEDISPVTLQCWKNGTISIDEVLPIETTHTVALNKSAQIQKNIEELSILKNRVEVLEKQYNNSTLNQAYELELLRLDMQLDNII